MHLTRVCEAEGKMKKYEGGLWQLGVIMLRGGQAQKYPQRSLDTGGGDEGREDLDACDVKQDCDEINEGSDENGCEWGAGERHRSDTESSKERNGCKPLRTPMRLGDQAIIWFNWKIERLHLTELKTGVSESLRSQHEDLRNSQSSEKDSKYSACKSLFI